LTQFVIPKSKSDSQPSLSAIPKNALPCHNTAYSLKTLRVRHSGSAFSGRWVLAAKVRSNGQRVDKTKLETEKGRTRNAETEGFFTD
jgi:hypothetical protein